MLTEVSVELEDAAASLAGVSCALEADKAYLFALFALAAADTE